LLVQHKIWRQCHLRVFTVTEGVSREEAESAAQLLTKTLRQRRLFDVDVEVILIDDEMIEPYTYDSERRSEDRHRFLEEVGRQEMTDTRAIEAIPDSIDDLVERQVSPHDLDDLEMGEERSHVTVSDMRTSPDGDRKRPSRQCSSCSAQIQEAPSASAAPEPTPAPTLLPKHEQGGDSQRIATDQDPGSARSLRTTKSSAPAGVLSAMVAQAGETDESGNQLPPGWTMSPSEQSQLHHSNVESFQKLIQTIHARSKRAQLVVMNLPDISGSGTQQVNNFMLYCDTLTAGLDRVLFVHSSGREIFDISL
jgi:hypothetical protein